MRYNVNRQPSWRYRPAPLPVLLVLTVCSSLAYAQGPVISSVVNGASFLPAIQSNSWITIRGTNLAQTSRVWDPQREIVNGRLPTALDGVSVTVGSKAAVVYYISPTQINALAPTDTALGPISVTVTNEKGTSPTFIAQLQRYAPGFFVFDRRDGRYAAATLANGTYVGPPGLFGAALMTLPARPRDVIVLYGTGFGSTNPPVPSDRIFTGAAPLVDRLAITIGDVQASVQFAGMSGPGLCQFNVEVPDVPDGDQALIATIGGMRTQRNVFIAIKRAQITFIHAAESWSCALDASGHLWCWGENGSQPGGYSTFGNGNAGYSAVPVLAAGGMVLNRFFAAPTQSDRACGIASGRAYCRGNNFAGQLGDGTITSSFVPVPVAGRHQLKAMALGEDYTCALDESGTAYCWGSRRSGALGNGTDEDTIQLLPSPVSGGLTLTAIAAAEESPTCALDLQATAHCWGWGGEGALGNGSTADATTPGRVSGDRSYKVISAGRYHFCAIDRSDDAYCWGSNSDGQLGNGSAPSRALTPALVAGGLKWSQISGGQAHSCGVTLAGDGYCWGEGEDGQLGIGIPTNNIPVPTLVAGNLKWRMISAGDEHSCGVTVDGVGYCWGNNGRGRLGSALPDHAIAQSPVPVVLP